MTPLERWLARQMFFDRARESARTAAAFFRGATAGRAVATRNGTPHVAGSRLAALR